MADISINSILQTLNNAGISAKQPALYQAIKSLVTVAKTNHDTIVLSSSAVQKQLNSTFTFGTATDRTNFIPTATTAGNLIFFFETDTQNLYVFAGSQWYQVGSNVNATYLTATNQVSILPLSRWVKPGINISFDDSVSGVRVINEEIHPFLLMGA